MASRLREWGINNPYVQEEDLDVGEQGIRRYLSHERRYLRDGLDTSEWDVVLPLVSLWQAAVHYHPSKGSSFRTYAINRCMWFMKRWLQQDSELGGGGYKRMQTLYRAGEPIPHLLQTPLSLESIIEDRNGIEDDLWDPDLLGESPEELLLNPDAQEIGTAEVLELLEEYPEPHRRRIRAFLHRGDLRRAGSDLGVSRETIRQSVRGFECYCREVFGVEAQNGTKTPDSGSQRPPKAPVRLQRVNQPPKPATRAYKPRSV